MISQKAWRTIGGVTWILVCLGMIYKGSKYGFLTNSDLFTVIIAATTHLSIELRERDEK